MKTLALCLIIAAALFAPVRAGATLARPEPSVNDNFDGARVRPEKEPVRAGALTDSRTQEQIAIAEQAKADSRVNREASASEIKAGPAALEPAPADTTKRDRLIGGVMGAVCGLLGGGLLAYGLSRLTA